MYEAVLGVEGRLELEDRSGLDERSWRFLGGDDVPGLCVLETSESEK